MLFLSFSAWITPIHLSVQFSYSVMSDSFRPMNHSTPGLPVHHQLPEFTQTHVYWVGDAIQPSHLCRPLFLLPPIPPASGSFANEPNLSTSWPKDWNFSFSISPSNECSGLIPFRIENLISLLSKGLSRVFSIITICAYQFFGAQPSLWSNSHIRTWLLEKS